MKAPAETGAVPDWPLEDERALWQSLCRPGGSKEWYYNLVSVALGVEFYCEANPDDRWFSPKLHRPLCAWLQHHIEEWFEWRRKGILRRKKLFVMMPRFTGKTQTITKTLPIGIWLEFPNDSGQLGSETKEMAQEFFRPISSILQGESEYGWFSWLYGTWKDPDRPWDKSAFIHALRTNRTITDPSLAVWGILKGITSKHPNWGILDDPLSEDKIREEGSHLKSVVDAVGNLRPAFRTNSLFIIPCTRKRDQDVAGVLLVSEGIRSWTGHPPADTRFIEALERDGGEWDVYFWQARDPETGESTLPMWTTEELDAYESAKPAEFAAEMMNAPGTGEDVQLTQDQVNTLMISVDDVPEDAGHWILLDTAFKDRKRVNTGDESVMIDAAINPNGTGEVYFCGGKGGNHYQAEDFTDDLIALVKDLRAHDKKVLGISDEREMGGKTGLWELYLRSKFADAKEPMPRLLFHDRSGTRKKIRMKEAVGFWVDGFVKVVRGAPGMNKLCVQYTRIDYVPHDDWADAAADIFAPDIYRPMLLYPADNEAPKVIRPGDEILRYGLVPRNVDELRDVYDAANPLLSPKADPDDELVDSLERWPY